MAPGNLLNGRSIGCFAVRIPADKNFDKRYQFALDELRKFASHKMRTPNLQNLSTEQLAERFKQLSLQQGEAEMSNDMRTYNRRSQQLNDICAELGRRGAESRRVLVPLLNCPRNAGPLSAVAQCRYNAARELLAVEPDRARATLEELANSVTRFQMALARHTLGVLDNGTLKPT